MSIATLFRHVDIDVPRYVTVNGIVVADPALASTWEGEYANVVIDQAAERTEALCSDAQRLGVPPKRLPLPKRQWWWIAAGALTVAGVAVWAG
jgi:hypothetical protein